MDRVLAVLALGAVLAAAWGVRRNRFEAAERVAAGEQLPAEVRGPAGDGSRNTWVLVTSPLCATCGPAEQRLREVDPGAHIVKVDAAERPDLARRLRAQAAPTLLLAGVDGRVRERVIGPVAVSRRLDLVPRP
jgi:hypothetical protein